MSKRQSIATLALVACLTATPVLAEEVSDRIVLWLEEQGFTNFEIKRTWLGRIKIEAYAFGVEREIIINARTGEILRDYWEIGDDRGRSGNVNLIPAPAGIGNARGVASIQKLDSEDNADQDDDSDNSDDDVDDDSLGGIQTNNEGDPQADSNAREDATDLNGESNDNNDDNNDNNEDEEDDDRDDDDRDDDDDSDEDDE